MTQISVIEQFATLLEVPSGIEVSGKSTLNPLSATNPAINCRIEPPCEVKRIRFGSIVGGERMNAGGVVESGTKGGKRESINDSNRAWKAVEGSAVEIGSDPIGISPHRFPLQLISFGTKNYKNRNSKNVPAALLDVSLVSSHL